MCVKPKAGHVAVRRDMDRDSSCGDFDLVGVVSLRGWVDLEASVEADAAASSVLLFSMAEALKMGGISTVLVSLSGKSARQTLDIPKICAGCSTR